MSMKTGALVVGLGEVGKPLLAILSKHYQTVGVDLIPPDQPIERADVMHICYPYQIKDFIDETCRYVELFKPSLTVINSTVAVGTTRQIARLTGADVVHSPVRGKHAHMQQDMHRYTKFIGAIYQRGLKRLRAATQSHPFLRAAQTEEFLALGRQDRK